MHTVYDLVRLSAARTPDHLAVVDDRTDRRLTYRALMEEIDALARGFQALGLAPGDIVATVLPNVYEHVLTLLSLHRLGAIPALVNPRLKPEEIAELIKRGRMTGVVTLPTAPLIAAIRSALPASAPVIAVGGTADGAVEFAQLRAADTGRLAPFSYDPKAPAYIFHTSGTTGLPKGVIIAHGATDGRLLYMSTQCGMRHGTHNRALGLMPLFHVVGFYSVLMSMLAFNGTYYVASAFDPAAAVDAIARHKISLVYGAPTHFHAILTAPNFAPDKIASVTDVIYAGAPMPGPLLDKVGAAFGHAHITNIYGTTEIMNALYLPDPVGKPHLYRPGFYSDVRVGKFGGSVHDLAAPGEEGELLVDMAADASFSGYLNRPDATAEKVQDGWYRTGDIIVRRPDGDFEVRGRVDDMILSGGENVHPDEIESLLLKNPTVKEVAVIGMPDDRWGEAVTACVVTDDPALTGDALDRFCRDSTLANFKRPRRYVFVKEIPRNASNKTLRRELRGRLMAEQAGARRKGSAL